jgi:hypothetical protein
MVDSLPLGEICWHWQRENEMKKYFLKTFCESLPDDGPKCTFLLLSIEQTNIG